MWGVNIETFRLPFFVLESAGDCLRTPFVVNIQGPLFSCPRSRCHPFQPLHCRNVPFLWTKKNSLPQSTSEQNASTPLLSAILLTGSSTERLQLVNCPSYSIPSIQLVLDCAHCSSSYQAILQKQPVPVVTIPAEQLTERPHCRALPPD